MKELEKAMKIAEAAYEKALFENAVSNLFVESIEAKEDKFLSRAEEIEEILSNMDEREFWSACGNYKLYHNDEVFDEQDLCLLMDEYDKLLDEDFFVNPHKEARRRTRKANRSHKKDHIAGNSYHAYGKDKKISKQHREKRLYNNDYGFKIKKMSEKESFMLKDINAPDPFALKLDNEGRFYYCDFPMLTDGYKGEFRIINGYCYPSNYTTAEEAELTVQAVRMSESGYTNTGESCHLTYIAHPTSDGNGYLSATVSINKIRIYDSFNGCFNRYRGIEKAVEIFNVLTDRKEVK